MTPPADAMPVSFFPIRHHSPACSLFLLRALDEFKPKQILVEAPVDFEPLINLLTDPATKPPVAIISLPPAKPGEEEDFIATYPFCVHSPELVALAWAHRNEARAAFIDLPVRHRQMRRRKSDGEPGPAPLLAEWRLDHNAYVSELCARRGVANGLALWDALFESQAGTDNWRDFFEGVGLYCRHTRDVTDPSDMDADGTTAREAYMAARLKEMMTSGPSPIAVVTGGFHTPALMESMSRGVPSGEPTKSPPASAHLIRYGFRQLDHFSGYGAGLPHPAYYDRFWRALHSENGAAENFTAGLLADFADHLRRTKPQLALPTPTLAAALLTAERLADLRDLPAPGRSELIDAVRSAGVKDALELDHAPLLDALAEFLTGEAIGEVPPGAAQPPIIEAVRSQARALGFNLDDTSKRTRDLDILRRPRHAQASRFLFSLDLAGTGFATRIAGPDPLTGWRGDVLFETWSYTWSPMVESQLIARSADGQTLEALCLAELERRRARLMEEGLARSAGACAGLLVAAVRTGFERAVERAAAWCGDAIKEDPEAVSIIRALAITAGLARPGPGAPELAPKLAMLRSEAFERLILLFPRIVDVAEDQLPGLIAAIRELAGLIGSGDEAIERERLGEVTKMAISSSPPPALDGALVAFAGLTGAMPDDAVAEHITAMLGGAYVEAGKAAAVLTGCLAVSPKIIVHSQPLLAAADGFFERMDQDLFLATLPELRLAFSQLTPSEIDRVAAWAAGRHGLEVERILDDTIPANELAENMKLMTRLEEIWREDALGAWLEAPA